MKIKYLLYALLLAVAIGCGLNKENSDNDQLQFERQNRNVPEFNTDSAYAELVKQVQAGPRNPNSKGHDQVREYLVHKLRQYAGNRNVFVQHFTQKGYDGDTLSMGNIIAAFNPTSSDRIMICAHWDTRPRAENDSVNTDSPILGADDGASGVAMLLEMARLFSQHSPPIGVDIILFDGEDYGKEGNLSRYFLGSRYWSNHPPVKNYNPRFGILLDMVAGQNANFPKELNSMQFAPALVNEIWDIADNKGYDSLFVQTDGARISDDHLVINRIRNIPTIDIVRHTPQPDGSVDFAPYWHTHNDDLDIIDKNTIKAVGNVLTELIYNRI